jgi:hypothetical protein
MSGISGPFAAGPGGITRSASARRKCPVNAPLTLLIAELGRTLDPSIIIENAPIDLTSTSQTPQTSTPKGVIKTENIDPKKPSLQSKPKPSRVKREQNLYGEDYTTIEDADLENDPDRVDLSQLNLPGGPISSNRRPENRPGRGWRKVELWIEHDEPQEIVIDDDELEESASRTMAPARVKIEDERMDIVGEEEMGAESRMDLDKTEIEELARVAQRRRLQLRKKAMKGKSREEKEEMAREHVDFEALTSTFLDPDPSQVTAPAHTRTHLLELGANTVPERRKTVHATITPYITTITTHR